MTMRRRSGLVGSLTALAACVAAGTVDAGQQATLVYDIHVASLPVARLEMMLEAAGSSYRATSTLQTVGLTDMRVGWRVAQQSQGHLVDGEPWPRFHSNAGEWRAVPRSVQLAYAGRSIEVQAEPSADAEGRPPVAAEARAGTVDLMSALAQLAFSDSPEAACAGTRRIFDGRRRYDMVLTADSVVTLAPPAAGIYQGRALRCLVSVRRLAGFPADGDDFEIPERLLLWLTRDRHAGLVVPVRLQATSPYGLAVMHLSSIAIDVARHARHAD